MESEKIRDWLELIGIFGVIASLIFVGLQMRQTHRIAISEANLARTDTSMQYLLTVATDPVIRSYLVKFQSGNADAMTPEEWISQYYLAFAGLLVVENIFHQYQDGFVTDERWQGTRRNLELALTGNNSSMREFFESDPSRWSRSYRHLIEEILAASDPAK